MVLRESKRRGLKLLLGVVVLFLLPVTASLTTHYFSEKNGLDWYELRRDSSQQAPDPFDYDGAIIQVYAARALRWRGAVGVHPWIAFKRSTDSHYTRVEVFGYMLRWRGETVSIRSGSPDSYWYGSKPWLLREIRGGADVDALIDRLVELADNYPYNETYRVWPGPNSNTFVAWLGRKLPELQLELPPTAIGKDYLPGESLFASTPSDTGYQVSLFGAAGFLLALEEGIELNLLGFTAGVDLYPPALKLPGLGRIGFEDYKNRSADFL